MTDGLHLRLLGGLQITVGDSVVDAFTSKKTLALLAYLAITSRAHSRESLSGLLWGDWPEDQARASLRTVLWDLRQQLPSYVSADRHTISYSPDASCWVDVLALREAAEGALRGSAAATHQGEHTTLLENTQVSALEDAVSLYRGDLMAGFFVSDAPEFEDWMLGERERVRNLVLSTMHRLLIHYRRAGAYRRGIDTANRLLGIAPWQEEVHRDLMRLFALNGQRSEALVQYNTCRKMLADELGVEPTMETRLLYRQIRAGRPLKEEGAGRGASALDRLPCLDPASRMPVLVGRDEEMTALKQLLSEPGGGLVTLVGPEGVGKTSLATSAAAQLAAMFDGGVRYISLGTGDGRLTEPDDGEIRRWESPLPRAPEVRLPLRIARAFGLPLSAPAPELQLLDYLRRRESLVILDDFEVSATEVDFLLGALNGDPCVKLLVIADVPLAIEGEQVLHLGGLAVPAGVAQAGPTQGRVAELMAYDSVRMFVERAERTCTDFELSAGNARYVSAICRGVAGLPLAIELVTPWVEELSVREIADSIEYRLKNLGPGDGQERDANPVLQAAFLHSWDRISSAERGCLSDLAHFSGDFSAKAALQIVGASSALLRGLVKKGLLRSCGSSRYECHPAVRRFSIAASEAQESGYDLSGQRADDQVFRHGYCTYYIDLLASRTKDLRGPDGQAACAEIYSTWHHVRRAWYGAVAEADVELLERGLAGLVDVVLIQGWHEEGVDLLQHAVRALESRFDAGADSGRTALIDRLSVHLAQLFTAQRLPEEARRTARAVIDRSDDGKPWSESGRRVEEVEAAAHRECGRALHSQGKLRAAREHLEHALSSMGHEVVAEIRASALMQLAAVEMDAENLDAAWDHLNEARVLYQTLEDDRGQAQALTHLVLAATARRDRDAAEAYAREALVLSEILGDGALEGTVYARMGRLACSREDYARARTHCERALGIARELAHPELKTEALTELALADLGEGKKEEAWRRSLLAVELARTSGGPPLLAKALLLCGHTFTDLGMGKEARQAYEEAREIQATLGQEGQLIESVAGLARASLVAGDSRAAKRLVEEILPRLGEGDLAGVRDPMRVFLACHQVLQTVRDPRAFDVLAKAARLYDDAPSDQMLAAAT